MTPKYSHNPAMFRNNPIGFILAILLIPAFGLGILILAWWYLQTKAAKLTIWDSEIHFEKGLLNKEHYEVGIGSIRTIRVKQSLFNRMFGVGSIEIYSAGDSPEIVAKGMPDPNRLRELIKMTQGTGSHGAGARNNGG